MNNIFEEVVKREDFSIYKLFVAAYEFNLDDSEPPTNARERRSFTPKHEIRVVLSSIAMAAILPVLQLQPNVRKHLVIGADSTFKLAIIKLLKVIII